MKMIEAKTILSKVNYGNTWYGIDYCINLYRGCSHGCIYCDSRSSCYHIDHFNIVRGKINAIQILGRELSKVRKKGVIGIGSMSDPYNPNEKEFQQTREALKLIAKYGFGVSIDTKSNMILRDIDKLKEIRKRNNVIVKFTITTPKDELSRIIEPNVCPSSMRFSALKSLTDNGIFAGITLTPVLPYITDSEEDIKELIRLASASGARFIYTDMGMTLRQNQRDDYFNELNRSFIGLKSKYIKRYGNRYFCPVPNAKRLYKVFTEECEKYGILYKMEDIINAYKKESPKIEQITLF